MNIYQQELLDHYKFPKNRGTIESPTFKQDVNNFSCGDKITIYGLINNNVLEQVSFEGYGCVISQATASILTEYVINQNKDTILKIDKDTILNLIKIPVGPTRLRCALLCLEALHSGILKS